MPRQIIDTESSRPRYVRRMTVTWIAIVIVLALVAFVVFETFGHLAHAGVPGK